ncbi:hypothetical protein SAMN05216224_108143 [Thioclava dalianensis]|uniref:hypothetical protein n=1 Tax=Thioclava dalianensis TaxID=1185766 RepID=UPI0008F6664A|nr:hypothetical protein [Thioclava dalianensis]SFN65219.1 hypothetical protein SAMN05216224_108143 [Thioclava dalianensis]
MIPSLNLSSGPAVSGGPTSSGAGTTGGFYYNSSDWKQTAAKVVPVVLVAGAVWWLLKR